MDSKRWKLPLRRVPTYENKDHSVYWTNTHVAYEQTLFGGVAHCTFSNNGKYLGVVSTNHSLVLRLPASEGSVWSEQQSRKCHSIRFREDGRLAVQAIEKRVVIKSTDTAYERQLQGHTRDVRDALFLTSQQIVSASDDTTVKVWDYVTEQELAHTVSSNGGHTDYVRTLASVPGGNCFFSGGYDHQVKLWDTRVGLETPVGQWILDDQVQATEFVDSKSMLVTSAADCVYYLDVRGAADGELKVKNTSGDSTTNNNNSKSNINNLPGLVHRISNHTKTVSALAYIPERDVLVTASLDKRMKFTSLNSADQFQVVATKKMNQPITAVAVSPNARLIAVGDSLGHMQLHQVEKLADHQEQMMGEEGEFGVGVTASTTKKKEKIFQDKAEEVRRALVSYKYQRALQTALYSRQPNVILTTVEELQKRGALRVAISGNNDRTIVQLLRWATDSADVPQFVDVAIHVIDIIMEIYGQAATASPFFHRELLKAHRKVGESLSSLEALQQSVALMEMATLTIE